MTAQDAPFYIFLLALGGGGALLIFLAYFLSGRHRTPKTTVILEQKKAPTRAPAMSHFSEQPVDASPFVPINLPVESVMDDLAIVHTKDLRKTFPARGKRKGAVEAVRGITFQVRRGEIFGLLGPNGAGKTTTMRMLCTLLTPTAGEVKIAGYDLIRDSIAIRSHIGYVSQVGGMQREATGRENLMLQATLYGMSPAASTARVDELVKLLNLEEYADRKTVTYSGGQRRIFDLASGIVHRPKLLFLDEPSTGLDPQNRAHVWEQIKKLRDQGTTIFVTTHYLDEADALCDRVAIVDHGMIVAIGTPDELKRQIAGDSVNLSFANEAIAEKVAALFKESSLFIKEIQTKESTVHLYVDKGDEHLPEIMKLLHEHDVAITSIQLSRPSLDDVFLKITGRSLQES